MLHLIFPANKSWHLMLHFLLYGTFVCLNGKIQFIKTSISDQNYKSMKKEFIKIAPTFENYKLPSEDFIIMVRIGKNYKLGVVYYRIQNKLSSSQIFPDFPDFPVFVKIAKIRVFYKNNHSSFVKTTVFSNFYKHLCS